MSDRSAFENRWFRLLWVVFLLSLPVTSFPFFPAALGGTATVRPLAIYPLILLMIVVIGWRLFRERIPRTVIPLLIFVLVALLSSVLVINRPTPDLRGVSSVDRVVRNLITLGLGVSFYLVVSLVPRTREDLVFTVRWILIGFAAALLWSTIQSVYVLNFRFDREFWRSVFDRLNVFHRLFSTRNLQKQRVVGFAYEPSWFAEQLSILVFPWLLTAVIRRRSFFKRKIKQLIVEDVMLVWALAMMVLTFSRTGLAILFVLLGITILVGTQRRVVSRNWVVNALSAGKFRQRVGLLATVLVVLGAVIFSASANNPYFSRMWLYFTDENAGGNYWTYIAFGQRFIYWDASIEMFEEEPLLGVGLGNFALHFEEKMPTLKLYQYPEILELIVPEKGANELVTPKHLFLRVLAETGVLGVTSLAAFFLVVFGEAFALWWHPSRNEIAYLAGRAGVLGMVAALLVTFSTDSFAMPNLWVMAGLITAAGRIQYLPDTGSEPETE